MSCGKSAAVCMEVKRPIYHVSNGILDLSICSLTLAYYDLKQQ
jgi:hypothetical protein